MSNPVDTQRTYALVGTGGCGKTSLAEMLLFNSGALTRMGAIEDGTTCLDYEPEEVRRRGSIQPAVATCLWNKNRHFMLDIPGDGNFTGDMECLLKGVDGVVFVLDAVDGVRPLTKKFWNLTRAENLPAIFVINKMDRDRADFQMAFDGLSTLGVKAVALQVPIREGEAFTGYVDVLTGKAYTFGADGAVSECDVPADVADDVSLLHDLTVENIAESDEELMEKYLEEGSLSLEDLQIGADLHAPKASASSVVGGCQVIVPLKGAVDLAGELARLDKEMAKLEKDLVGVQSKLHNESFVSRAPAQVVERERARAEQLLDAKAKMQALRQRFSEALNEE